MFFETQRPGAQNEAIFYSDYVMSVPSFSKPGGLMVGAQSIKLSTDFGGDIRYTLDGSWPNERSFLYEATDHLLKKTRLSEQPFLSLISFQDP